MQSTALAAKVEMLIRRPVAEVFEAFVDPDKTTKFWFSRGSGRLEAGKRVEWYWDMYELSAQVDVKAIDPDRRILIEWGGEGEPPTTVEWLFTPRSDNTTLVSITHSGFVGDEASVAQQVAGSTGGFSLVVAGLKAWLEHGIQLNLIADRFPDGHPA